MDKNLTCVIAAENAQAIADCLPALFAKAELTLPALVLVEHPHRVADTLMAADVLLAQPAWVAPVLHRAKNLRWMQSTFAGIEVLMGEDVRTDYPLTGVKDIFGPLMSEYVFAAVLAHARNSAYYRRCQAANSWQPVPYQSLAGRQMAIIGLGSIGIHVARTAKHFGLRVLGVNRTGQAAEGVDEVIALSQLQNQLAQADFVVLALPSTPATVNLIDAAFLKPLKPQALLINVGRGALVNEADLVRALSDGTLGAAVLDVFKEEPLSPDNPLWQAPNVTITPHNAAVTFAPDIANIFCQNYGRFLRGEPLLYQINFDRGY